MRAAVFEEVKQPLALRDIDILEPGPRDVVVRLTASGICHTDLHVVQGELAFPSPGVLGHEGAGVVEQVGSAVSRVEVGDTVITSAVPVCGTCPSCIAGGGRRCDLFDSVNRARNFRSRKGAIGGFTGLGTFAEKMTVHEASVVPVRTALPPEELALIGCGVVTGIGAVVNSARMTAGSSVAVFGCGAVGLAVIQGARLVGASRVIGVDPYPMKLDSAARCGATDLVNPRETDPVDAILSLTSGGGVDYGFEAYGSADTYLQTYRAVRRGGTAVVIGLPGQGEQLSLPAQEVLTSGKTLVGSIYGSHDIRRLFQRIVTLAEHGRIDLTSLITRTVDLGEINEAFEAMTTGSIIRAVISYGD